MADTPDLGRGKRSVVGRFVSLFIGLIVVLNVLPSLLSTCTVPATHAPSQTIPDKLSSIEGYFTENRGQVSESVRYYSLGSPSIAFMSEGIMFVLTEGAPRGEMGVRWQVSDQPTEVREEQRLARSLAYFVHFEGASKANPAGKGRLGFNSNFFLGNDSSRWRTDVPNFAEITYEQLYDGIDVVFRWKVGGLEYRFIIRDNVDSNVIRLRFSSPVSTPEEGPGTVSGLGYEVPREVRGLPCSDSSANAICGAIVIHGSGTTTPEAAEPSSAAGVDQLDYSTYLGGSVDEIAYSVDVDAHGNAYVLGVTSSPDFPSTPGTYDTALNVGVGWDLFVTKLNNTCSGLLFSTFIGGADDDWGLEIKLNSEGNAFLTGYTDSVDFPTTTGSFDTIGDSLFSEAFIAKLDESGSSLLYSTFIGGSRSDAASSIAMDEQGYAYIGGSTTSADFPITPGAIDSSLDGHSDAFVAVMNPNGSALSYSTLLGGESYDGVNTLALDGSGAIYVGGGTESRDFPVTAGAFDTTYNNDYTVQGDAFVAKIIISQGILAYSTYLGGTDVDYITSMDVDHSGSVYATGLTASKDYPTTPGVLYSSSNGADAGFVTKLSSNGDAVVFSTYLGGRDLDHGETIKLDVSGDIIVSGETLSSNFPVTPDAYDSALDYLDGFVTRLNGNGRTVLYSTFFGGSLAEEMNGMAVDSMGAAFVVGSTNSRDLPTTPGTFDGSYNGRWSDAYASKLRIGAQPNNPPVINRISLMPQSLNEGAVISLFIDATDPDGDPLQYCWDFDNDGMMDTPWSHSPAATHTWSDDFSAIVRVEVSDGKTTSIATAIVTISNLQPRIDSISIAAITAAAMLRIAGEKWHDVSAYMVGGGNETLMATLMREPGKPQETSFTITVDPTRSGLLRITYTTDDDKVNGQPNGATPAWLNLTFNSGPPVSMHHTFNVKHPETWNWTVSLNPLLAGRDIAFTATATDPGSDDLTVTWEWGEGTPATARAYFNDGTAPDPYPSPGGTFPFTATDEAKHIYLTAGTYGLGLTVRDDDGGSVSLTVDVIIG